MEQGKLEDSEMDDQVIAAGKNFIDADPILGSIIVVLMFVVASLILWIKSILKDKDVRTDLHMADVRKFAADTEAFKNVISTNSEQLRNNTETVKMIAEWSRSGDRRERA